MIADPALFGTPAGRRSLDLETEWYVTRASEMVRRARAVVTGNRAQLLDLLTGRREALARHLQGYQQFKHGCIFDPVVRHGTSSSQVVARTLKARCVEMGNEFAGYHLRWLRVEPDEWPLYRRDMIATAAVLLDHLAAERAAITRLLTISTFYGGSPRAIAATPSSMGGSAG